MNSLVLFSGGKDSSLVAYMLKKLDYKPKLLTANFGIVPDCYKTAEKSAKVLGFDFEVVNLDKEIIHKAADQAEKDGFPNHAINYVHHNSLEQIAEKYGPKVMLADGCRRDDRTPKLTFDEMRSLEDRFDIEYFSPLIGISYKTINYLTANLFKTEKIKAGKKPTSEYETEIRAVLRARAEPLERKIFPENHYHTIVKGWKNVKK